MATSIPTSLHHYMNSIFRPDREYVDGEVRERNVGKYEHARMQALFAMWFGQNERNWGVQVVTVQRVKVKPNRVRIPDVALLGRGPQPDVILEPPILVVEILSPDDRFGETRERIEDFFTSGVNSVWIVDPDTRSGDMWLARDRFVTATRLEVPGTPIYVDLSILFADLESHQR